MNIFFLINNVNLQGDVFCIIPASACGGTLTSPFGELMSPNYPNAPPRGLNCTWTIQGPEDAELLFDFDDFDLAANDDNEYFKVVYFLNILCFCLNIKSINNS